MFGPIRVDRPFFCSEMCRAQRIPQLDSLAACVVEARSRTISRCRWVPLSDLDAGEIGILAPTLKGVDVVEQASGVGEIANRPGVDRLLLTVVEAGCAALEISGTPCADGQEEREPLLFRGFLRFHPDDSLVDAGLDDVGHVSSRLGEQVREVRAEPTLDEADKEQVGESAGQHSVQRVCALGPPLRERKPANPLGVKAESLMQVRRDFESRGVDQQVHRVLDTVDDRTSGGDLVDTASFRVDEVDVGRG